MLKALVCLFSCAAVAQKLEAVPLLLKPKEETGRITIAAEGLDVPRNAPKVFGIIAAVGPTCTGKSTILGRAFLRGKHENAFEIGGGVTSFTTGAHITNKPVLLDMRLAPDRARLAPRRCISPARVATAGRISLPRVAAPPRARCSPSARLAAARCTQRSRLASCATTSPPPFLRHYLVHPFL